MATITSDCDVMRYPSIKWPNSPRIVRPPGGNSSGAEITTLFVTPDPSVKLQDSFRLEPGYEACMGMGVPSLFFSYNRAEQESWREDSSEATMVAKTMRDFSGMDPAALDKVLPPGPWLPWLPLPPWLPGVSLQTPPPPPVLARVGHCRKGGDRPAGAL